VSARRFPDISEAVANAGGTDKVRLVLESVPFPGVPRLARASEKVANFWAKPPPPPVATGIESLDKALDGGLRPESMYVLSARSGRGKTGLAVQVATSIARTRPILWLGSELTERQQLARFGASITGEPWRRLFEAGPEVQARLVQSLEGLRLHVVELTRDTKIRDVAQAVAEFEGEHPIIVLDYLQHAARRLNPDDRRLAVAALSDDLTAWTRVTRSTALVISAVARTVTDDDDKTAMDYESAAKESGDVDYDAAGLLYLQADPCPESGWTPAKLHVSKHRFGPAGQTVGLRFWGATGRFEEDPRAALSEEHEALLEAIRAGATTSDEAAKSIKMRATRARDVVRALLSMGLIERTANRSLRVREAENDAV
jgi:replicative DNA helicase